MANMQIIDFKCKKKINIFKFHYFADFCQQGHISPFCHIPLTLKNSENGKECTEFSQIWNQDLVS